MILAGLAIVTYAKYREEKQNDLIELDYDLIQAPSEEEEDTAKGLLLSDSAEEYSTDSGSDDFEFIQDW